MRKDEVLVLSDEDRRRFELADLRSTCRHEHGHAAVARAFGVDGEVKINRADASNEKYYTGCFVPTRPISPRELRIVGLAGAISEKVLHYPEYSFDDWQRRPPKLSESAAAWAHAFCNEDVKDCIALVKKLREEIGRMAEFELERIADRDGLASTVPHSIA